MEYLGGKHTITEIKAKCIQFSFLRLWHEVLIDKWTALWCCCLLSHIMAVVFFSPAEKSQEQEKA